MSSSEKKKVFVTRAIPQVGLDLICSPENNLEVEIWPEAMPPPQPVLLEKVRGVHGLLCLLTDQVDKELLDTAGPQLRVVSQMAVGYNNIDVQACTELRIPVGNTPGVLTDATADLTVALMLASSRQIVASAEAVKNGEWKTWEPMGYLGPELWKATVGIVGMGRIGYSVAQRLLGFQVKLLYHDICRNEKAESELGAVYVNFDTLLRESDFLSLHCLLSPETRHLINSETLAKMKRTAVLINASRGEVVDTDALYDALKTGTIAFAGLDTTDPEPLPASHPLLQLNNVTVLPHIGSASIRSREAMATIAAQNLLNGLQGRPLLHCVNKICS